MKLMVNQGYIVLDRLHSMLNTVSRNIGHINQADQNIYIGHAGPSGLTHEDSLSPDPPHEDFMNHDHPAQSPPPNDDGENLISEVYGLSNLCRSR